MRVGRGLRCKCSRGFYAAASGSTLAAARGCSPAGRRRAWDLRSEQEALELDHEQLRRHGMPHRRFKVAAVRLQSLEA